MTEPFRLAGRRVWVAGHRGMVGAALVRRLERENCAVITAGRDVVDLTRQDQVEAFLARETLEVVIIAAAKVGGILANDTYPADFLAQNLSIELNIIEAAHRSGIEKLLFLGSSCIYPRLAPQPIPEEALLTGPLEPTNEWYAVAKIAGIKLCQAYRRQHGRDYISAMPTNLYGPGDNFDLKSSHVLPALIRKAEDARASGASKMVIWGSGTPLREFMHVDDCADALIHLLKHYSGESHLNVGTGEEVTILDLARLVAEAVGFKGTIVTDATKPDGTPRKLMDSSKLHTMGWTSRIPLREGIAATVRWYRENAA